MPVMTANTGIFSDKQFSAPFTETVDMVAITASLLQPEETGWEKHPKDDLFCVEWDVKTSTRSINNLTVSTDVHVQMNDEFNSGHSEDSSIFAVSAEWFRTWQRFVRGDSEGKLQLFCEVC